MPVMRLAGSGSDLTRDDAYKFVPRLACFFCSSRGRHTSLVSDWSSDVCSSDLVIGGGGLHVDLVEDPVPGELAVEGAVQRDAACHAERPEPGRLAPVRDDMEQDPFQALLRSEERRVGKGCRVPGHALGVSRRLN